MPELQVSRVWQYGPDWLKDIPKLINTDGIDEMPAECSRELKTSNKKTHNLAATEGKHAHNW